MDDELLNELMSKKGDFHTKVVNFRNDVHKINAVFKEIRKELYGLSYFLHNFQGHHFFFKLEEDLKRLERLIKTVNLSNNRDRYFFSERMIMLKNRFVHALHHEFAHEAPVFFIVKLNKFKSDVESCDPMQIIDVLQEHFKTKELVINVDLTGRTHLLVNTVISKRSSVSFPDFHSRRFQFLISGDKTYEKKKVPGTGFFANVAFAIHYFRFVIFDCNGGFVLSIPNHACWNPRGNDKTIIIDSNCHHKVRSIEDGPLEHLLLIDFNSSHFWAMESVIMKNSGYNIPQRNFHPMPNLSARNADRGKTGNLGIQIDGKGAADRFTSLGFTFRYFVVDHITPYVV